MSIPRHPDPLSQRGAGLAARVVADGKFLRVLGETGPARRGSGGGAAGGERFRIKGVSYGTFAPDGKGDHFPEAERVAEDFAAMAALGINTVRVYTPPRPALLDEAARHGLRVMVGLPWSQHVAFLDDRRLTRAIRRDLVAHVRALGDHPAALLFALGSEIPAGVVRWHGRLRVERFLRELYADAKGAAPESLFTYVNFPPTEYLDLSSFDVCAFNVYLHREPELRAYLARLQHLAGHKPLLLAEAGADSIREGAEGQAAITEMHVRAALEEGACGAVAYAWTDEWWRGGRAVDDWAFGLVDRERRPKPAAAAVAAAFADAPYPAAVRERWPRVSVVVCAYDAADTLEDCLSSLAALDYPDYEIVLVNDGSRDATGEIARRHARTDGRLRVIDTPNQGLSAARNVGLAAATGEIVAYTDADVRADPDWLTFLMQPLLDAPDVVGSGGPNVVPADDPPIAQCVARAPGGPTHVLLDDRTAEHVPGCNMAFRRAALLEVGGFDPIYVRAGDDVDICWQLQGRGWRIGFAPAALVWHHHRASVRAYWRQQVGYGEGETWLMAHHPEQFLEGKMRWRGRIYSPLPFVRSLAGTRVNAGVWGTAAFPSVYRTDVHPFAFMPHSIRWQALSLTLVLVGVLLMALGLAETGVWAGPALLAAGLAGLAVTLARNAAYALRSDLSGVPGSHLRHRATIAYLHFVQPLARAWGRVRGMLAPPEVVRGPQAARPTMEIRPGVRDVRRGLLLALGGAAEDRFWSERWAAVEGLLARLTERLRRARPACTVAVDDGSSADRDVSVLVGRWAWLDLRALVEEHRDGKCLIRIGTHLRPTALGVATAVALGLALMVAASAGFAYRWPAAGVAAAGLTLGLGVFVWARTARAAATVRQALERVSAALELAPLRPEPARAPLLAPSLPSTYGIRSAPVFVLTILSLGASTFLLRDAAISQVIQYGPRMSAWLDTPGGLAIGPAGHIYLADAHSDAIRRIDAATLASATYAGDPGRGAGFTGDGGPAARAQLAEPDGIAFAPDGDLIVADSENHRIRRIDRETGVITTIAGSGVPGWNGDGLPALETAFDQPSAVACAPNGDIYVADTMNNRVRRIDHATGLISTVAGNGRVAEDGPVGDGRSATEARLFMPSDVALGPDGDLYVADTHHNRIRVVDRATGRIRTVAGSGAFGNAPDAVPATEGALSAPTGIALLPGAGGLTLFIADSYNAVVRRIGPDGVMYRVEAGETLLAPARVAFAPASGWLYVTDAADDKLVALSVPGLQPRPADATASR